MSGGGLRETAQINADGVSPPGRNSAASVRVVNLSNVIWSRFAA